MTEPRDRAGATPPHVVAGAELPWQPSPSPWVWRKRLYHVGPAEAGTVTSIVRYDAGARFPPHPHPDGEEILVLSGTFSDERGDFAAGSHLLSPEGFSHAPFSREGCLLFVKLRQYPGLDRQPVISSIERGTWQAREPGARSLTLYRSAHHPEFMRLTELAAGAELPEISLPEGEEIFVVRGELSDEYGSYGSHTWLRFAPGSAHRPRSAGGCLLYVCSPAARSAAAGPPA
ncbi:MAG TPA: cupin domain-containing protein [Polyangiaceae bacterium]|nr:cupin domain-containing protein [Polyangiaceae bacterium]